MINLSQVWKLLPCLALMQFLIPDYITGFLKLLLSGLLEFPISIYLRYADLFDCLHNVQVTNSKLQANLCSETVNFNIVLFQSTNMDFNNRFSLFFLSTSLISKCIDRLMRA